MLKTLDNSPISWSEGEVRRLGQTVQQPFLADRMLRASANVSPNPAYNRSQSCFQRDRRARPLNRK